MQNICHNFEIAGKGLFLITIMSFYYVFFIGISRLLITKLKLIGFKKSMIGCQNF